MNQLANKWILKDNYIAIDKPQFIKYLSENQIDPKGYLKEILYDDDGTDWRYFAYVSGLVT